MFLKKYLSHLVSGTVPTYSLKLNVLREHLKERK